MPRTKKIVTTKNVPEDESFKKYSLFDVLSEIEGDQRPWMELPENFHKAYSQFMLNRLISSKEHYVMPIELISRCKVSDQVHYEYCCSFINKQKHYFNYKAYKNTKDEDKLAVYAMRMEYQISPREAEDYIECLTDEKHPGGIEELEKIKNKWAEHFKTFGKSK